MSFILDALKKSEKERQREAVPGLGDLPIVIHQTRTSTWTVTVIVALGLGVVALSWIWWRTLEPADVVARSTPAVVTAPEPAAAPRPVTDVAPAPGLPPATRSLASEATRMAATGSGGQDTPAATAPIVVPAAPSVITPAPMSILQARASGLAVPELALELLVYSDVAAQRFVFVNGSKYVEGDVLAEGPRVIEISTEGATLSYGGQNFLLPQE